MFAFRSGQLLIGAMAAFAFSSCSSRTTLERPTPTASRPNIIFLLADDLGYADLGVQGSKQVSTPNIDRLAAQGVRLTQGYAGHPVCSPSRASLLTGKYQHRFGFENNPTSQNPEAGIPVNEPLISETLKAAGYKTAMIGKWHVGSSPDKIPPARGFDSFYGFLGGAMAYTPDGPAGNKYLIRGTERVAMPAHTTEAFADEAVSFIEANKDQPFFAFVAFNAVHAPLQSTDPYLQRFSNEKDPRRRAYLAMLAALDDAVGKIVDAVDRNGMRENTLIVFTSDNGGPTWQTTSSNAPLSGVKALTLEGGIRVPTIYRWTGVLPEGRTSNIVAMGFDNTTTMQAAAGVPIRADQDGVNLIPLLEKPSAADAHKQLFWRSGAQGAMREGDWKLVKVGADSYLFNLNTDIEEHKDLAKQDAGRLVAMQNAWQRWSDTLPPPAWGEFGPAVSGDARTQGLRELVAGYVAGKDVDPKPYLYGGGPE